MRFDSRLSRSVLALAGAAVLSACGGGGGGGTPATPTPVPAPQPSPTPTPPPAPLCEKVRVVADASVELGKTASASVLPCLGTGDSIADVSWTQLSGPSVSLLANRSPTLAFEAASTGTVALQAVVTMADGSVQTVTASVPVTAAPAGSYVTVRADQSVRMEMDTSVRAWPVLKNGETLGSISWTQTEGPAVTMNVSDGRVMMFTAPKVEQDTVLKFKATMKTSSGASDSDEVTIAVEHTLPALNGNIFDAVDRVHPYISAGQYAKVLQPCVYDRKLNYVSSSNNNFCTLATLPPLATEAGLAAVPSVEQVMSRVLTSHDALAANFEAFLRTQDVNGDFRRLLAGVTAVVIGAHVRPSYYTPASGAIYLDADNFWLSAEQRDLVTEVPDYRSDFGAALNFTPLGRQVKNNAYARRTYSSTARVTRSLDELINALGRLLYHELGHASDYLAPSVRASLNMNKPFWDNVVGRVNQSLPSDVLARTYPLTSQEWLGLGQVLYRGATPTAVQKAYTAAQVGAFFASDGASDDYAYSINGSDNSREDLAMLFEEFMMSYRHGVQYDTAYSQKLSSSDTADTAIVGWGQRGRIADPKVKPRIKLVLQRMAPWIDPAEVDKLPAPIQMTPGLSWTANLAISPVALAQARISARVQGLATGSEALRADLRRGAH
ncbi:hypothetical protein [Massilia sp. TS11]|uniref:hypothetical protein n=1 Tax=Massilia sp. TS11 TaxID=2908003 RepID=UPI001EDB65BC|nr:hypothetical protein [Massilia sp. TS11]MCG2585674.1 hypothetical protein [Massilia sp. TS11]